MVAGGGSPVLASGGKRFRRWKWSGSAVVSQVLLDPRAWAEQQFSGCEFHDQRRNQRMITMATQAAARPDGSTPDQTETWADCKAAYRLMDCDDLDHTAIVAPHTELTRLSCRPGAVKLILNDTTELDFGRDVVGLGPVGRGTGRGFFLHSGLMRDADTGVIDGLAGQILFHRREKSSKPVVAKNTIRRDPQRESAVWGQLIDQVGSPPVEVTWLHVGDRGADDYDVYLHCFVNDCGWVIRAARLNRVILDHQQQALELGELLSGSSVQGWGELPVEASGKRAARVAQVEIRFAPLFMPPPARGNDWIRAHAPESPLAMWVVELREVNAPSGVEPLHWVLLTSERVESLDDAQRILGYYRLRWVVEEYHKALKTGCRVEQRYYETSARLERVTGLLAVLAVRLLQIRHLADQTPDRPAADVVPAIWLTALVKLRRNAKPTMTLHQFIRHLGGLGGHLGRKRDGEPGWITLWRGVEKLLLILRGMEIRT